MPPAPRAQTDTPIHCAECGKYNERDAVTCAVCGAHLWIKCSKCGAKTARTASRCTKCHQRLRTAAFTLPRWDRRFRNRKKRRVFRALVLLALAALVGWLVYENLPRPERPPPNTATPAF